MNSVRIRPIAFLLLSAMVITFSAGCALGPKALRGNRLDYNISIQKSNNEDLLVNFVRSRYFEPLFFLQVGSVSASFNYAASLGAAGNIYERTPDGNVYAPSLGASVAEAPTIIYAPLQGAQAVKQLLAEISIDKFLLLVRTGWDIRSVMWMTVQRLGPLSNFDPGWKKDSPKLESYERFLELTRLLGEMHDRGSLEFTSIEQTDRGVASLGLRLKFSTLEEFDGVRDLLALSRAPEALPGGGYAADLRLSTGPEPFRPGDVECVSIRFKSFLGMLYDLSQSSSVASSLPEKGIPPRLTEWPDSLRAKSGPHEGLIRVRTSKEAPTDAFTAVFYRGRWHSIADEDARSKGHFALLGILFSLQSTDVPVVQPLLTLPAAQK